VMRIAAIYLATIRCQMQSERPLFSSVLARGLNEAVLSVVFLSYNLPYSDMFQQVAFIIIIITNLLTTIGVYKFTRTQRQTQSDVAS
jgi:NhaP-type Na+/H+ and K+/H+ antiporter